MEFQTPITNLSEAKKYFQAMGCSSFHMAREYPDRYEENQALNVSKDFESEWTIDVISTKLHELGGKDGKNDKLWWIHSQIADLILGWKNKFEKHLGPLLEATKSIESHLSQRDKLLVAESIVGRQDLKYRPGLIFRSLDCGHKDLARGFAVVARQFVATPFIAKELEERRQRLLANLQQTEASCAIHC